MATQSHANLAFSSKLNRNVKTMPKWVMESSDSVGPKPPPPPPLSAAEVPSVIKAPALPPKTRSTPEPDYEVIEFSGQQYSNEPMKTIIQMRSKTPDTKLKCTLCGSNNPWVICEECSQQIFCASCDDMFHKHPKRKSHIRKAIEQTRPPIPPKTFPGQPGPPTPIAPPRRTKRGVATPLLQRKDQTHFLPPTSPTPSTNTSNWPERVGSFKSNMNLMNRPLPDTPKTPTPSEGNGSSRSETPKSVFDIIQRPPSVAMEKIRSKACATLDRMAQLQQRYRQQKEERDRNRSGSITDKHHMFNDQWSNISPSPSKFRSGSMSSGLNSSHFDLTDDSNFNLFNQRQAHQKTQHQSHSVFNLNHISHHQQPEMTNGWMHNNSMQNAQSMAQLNCVNCHHQSNWNLQLGHQHMHPHTDEWNNLLNSQQQLNRSNLSLNVGPGYILPHNAMYPPPVFMNQRNMMYPYPYPSGMPMMSPGLVSMPPPSRSRMASRAGSHAPSPTMSRKSLNLRRKHRSSYADDEGTDDEDSEDDRRSITSNRSALTSASRPPRQRRLSSASQLLVDEDSENNPSRRNKGRRGSIAKSVQSEWLPSRRTTTTQGNSTARSSESTFNTPVHTTSRIYSDLDSEGSGTRALVQAKIQQKLEENSKKKKQRKKISESDSVIAEAPKKVSTEVQAGTVKMIKKEIIPMKEVEKKPPSGYQSVESESDDDEAEAEVEEKPKILVVKKEIPIAAQIKPAQIQKQQEPQKPIEQEQESDEEESDEEETEDEDEKDDEDAVEEKEQVTVNGNEHEESPPLGPPPSTPDHEWECEFCTFVNEPKIKICAICCKTPNKTPVKPKETTKPTPPPTNPTNEIKSNTTTTTTDSKCQSIAKTIPKTNPPITPKNTTNSSSTTNKSTTITPSTHGINNTKVSPSRTETDTNTVTPKGKESVEDVWAALDENIHAAADEVIKKAAKTTKNVTKVNTTTSPMREIGALQTNAPQRSAAKEIGTSPPPQTISTQIYEELPLRKTEVNQEIMVDVENGFKFPPNGNAQPQYYQNSEIKINPLHFTEHQPMETEFISNHIDRNRENNLERNIETHYYRDNPFTHYPSLSHQYHDRYRSTNDLRNAENCMPPMDFTSFNGSSRQQTSINELMSPKKNYSQRQPFPNDIPFSYDHKQAHDPETELYILLKEAEMYKFSAEELHAAIKYCGTEMHPVQWLKENWQKLIQTVQSLATKYGQERVENIIGTVSQNEARDALRKHAGNIWLAVSECIEERQKKFRDISSKGNFSREDIVTALTAHQGNVELALMDLGRTQLTPFLMRIWGSPGGVENESGNVIVNQMPTSVNLSKDINPDIHEFLSANASECFPIQSSSNVLPEYIREHNTQELQISNNYSMNEKQSKYCGDANKDFSADSALSNKDMLKDLETLIGNIELNQAKQSEHVLRSIESMLESVIAKRDTNHDPDSESMRILMKSPIPNSKNIARINQKVTTNSLGTIGTTSDVKNFMWQHIQEIVPDLVQQVEMDLMDDSERIEQITQTSQKEIVQEEEEQEQEKQSKEEGVNEDEEGRHSNESIEETSAVYHDEVLLEEAIKLNLKEASLHEELPIEYFYTSDIATFRVEFDRGLDRDHEDEFEFDSLEDGNKRVYKMFFAPNEEVETTKKDASVQQETKNSVNMATVEEPSLIENQKEITDILESGPSTSKLAIRCMKRNIKRSQLPRNIQRTKQRLAKMYSNKTNANVKVNGNGNYNADKEANMTTQKLSAQNKERNESISVSSNESSNIVDINRNDSVSESKSNSITTIQNNQSLQTSPLVSGNSTYQQINKTPASINEITNISNESVKDKSEPILTPATNPNRPRVSKIPVRRTLSSASLTGSIRGKSILSPPVHEHQSTTNDQHPNTILPKANDANNVFFISTTEANIIQDGADEVVIVENSNANNSQVNSEELFYDEEVIFSDANDNEIMNHSTSTIVTSKSDIKSEESSDAELYSVASQIEEIRHRDMVQSPTSDNELFLVLPTAEGFPTEIALANSQSNTTIDSFKDQPVKTMKEFIPSSDPSKQNLSELVEDTQRLIKQMKDEISIADFESSDEDGEEYTTEEDYSEAYDEEGDEYDENDNLSGEEDQSENDDDWEDYEDESISDISEEVAELEEAQIDEDEINETKPSKTINNDLLETNESETNAIETHQNDNEQSSSQNHIMHTPLINITDTSESSYLIELNTEKIIINEESLTNNLQSSLVSSQVSGTIATNPTMNEPAIVSLIDNVHTENNIPELPVEVALINGVASNETSSTLASKNLVNESLNPLIIDQTFKSDSTEIAIHLHQSPFETVLNDLNHISSPGPDNIASDTMISTSTPPSDTTITKLSPDQIKEMNNEDSRIANNTFEVIAETVRNDQSLELASNNEHQHEPQTLSIELPTSSFTEDSPRKSLQTEDTETPNTTNNTSLAQPSIVSTTAQQFSVVYAKVGNKHQASKIPKPKESAKESKRLPVRSKSFSSPMGLSTVKALQQQYLSKAQTTINTNRPNTIAIPTVVRKKSISDAITKFTNTTTSITSTTTTINKLNDGPSTSSGFRLRTHPRIPKKKYHETCFSDDDYKTTSSEEELESLEIRLRKQSVPVFRAYPNVQEPEMIDPEELARKFVDDSLVATISEAQIAAALVNMKFQQDVSIWAAKECSDLDQAIALLQQECELCMGTYAMNQIVSMLKCTHKCCKQCAKTYFTVQITDRSINDCNCPYCKIPELHENNGNEDENLEYFSNLDIFLKNILEPDVHELFQRKLRDRTLTQDPNFKWCVQCSSGFFARPKQRRLICPDCGSVTCSQCRKPWEKQHEGLSCEMFYEWKQSNDPELQVQGVQEHLAKNGIDCPKCKFRYSLARGGCMHFTCTQCKFEFCYGCAKPFMMGAKCTISPYCAKLGLHAHHPRNCLFYLRDKLPLQLQFLLKENGVHFEIEPIDTIDATKTGDSTEAAAAAAADSANGSHERRCPVPLQKETPTGLVDTVCNGDVPDKHAGMCRTHFVEYLTAIVAKAQIDPLPIFDLTDCVQELRRRGIPLPERGPWDTDEIYKGMCAEIIKKNIPLDTK